MFVLKSVLIFEWILGHSLLYEERLSDSFVMIIRELFPPLEEIRSSPFIAMAGVTDCITPIPIAADTIITATIAINLPSCLAIIIAICLAVFFLLVILEMKAVPDIFLLCTSRCIRK